MTYLRILLLLVLIPSLYGQRKCYPSFSNQPGIRALQPGGKDFEEKIRKLTEMQDKAVLEDGDSLYYIPVVVHVVHYGEAVGIGRNISDERIRAQINILNQDFGRQAGTPGFNSHPAGTDTRIRFCLADKDTNGNPTTGIVRKFASEDAFDLSQNAILKSYSFWNPEKYLNIWVCKLKNNYLGYAQYPIISPQWADSLPMISIENVEPDGVVIEYRVFGNVSPSESGPFPLYNKGRTATHEVGHYLGLIHIWGDGNSCADNKTDFCSDTPPQGNFTSGCPASQESCIAGTPRMKENYMDYTNDSCMNIFTLEQKKRMRIVLRNCIRRKTVFFTNSLCSIVNPVPLKNSPKISLRMSPESNDLWIDPTEIEINEIQIFDIWGRGLIRYSPARNAAMYPVGINLSNLMAGTYIVRVKDDQGNERKASFRRF